MNLTAALAKQPWLGWILRHRFLKFGTVGASGTLVNLAMLYLGQEYIFKAIAQPRLRLNVSLGLAIFCATINNFTWNRHWTWGDRKRQLQKPLLLQFGQYALACWLGIALQTFFTNLLATWFYYLVANLSAIALAGVVNFLVNDVWTFGRLRLFFRRPQPEAGPVPSDQARTDSTKGGPPEKP
jgi:putative flippase GtrA